MNTFKPTEEQLFDYYLKNIDPKLGRQIEDYLGSHPEIRGQFANFHDMEETFKSLPLDEPSERVLERVRAMARQNVSSGKNIFSFLQSGFGFRQLSWVLTIMLVVGMGYVLQELRDDSFVNTQKSARAVDSETASSAKAAATPLEDSNPRNVENLVNEAVDGLNKSGETNPDWMQEYQQALEWFQGGHFKKASDAFSYIMSHQPAFAKRVELYGYWIQALENLGALELADKKREELKFF